MEGAGLANDPKGPLFRTIGRGTGQLTRTALPQANAHAMIRRRAAAAGIATKIGNHTFRATSITAYLKNGGTLETASSMANHASTRTTQLYDRRSDEMSLDEIERILIWGQEQKGIPTPHRTSRKRLYGHSGASIFRLFGENCGPEAFFEYGNDWPSCGARHDGQSLPYPDLGARKPV
jgi:hypothetical protein